MESSNENDLDSVGSSTIGCKYTVIALGTVQGGDTGDASWFFLPDVVFLPCNHGLDFFDIIISLCENSN